MKTDNTVYYSVPEYSEKRKLKLEQTYIGSNSNCSSEDMIAHLDFLAIKAAENFCNYYGVNEVDDWPLEIVLYQGLKGPEIGRFILGMELKPTFSVSIK